MNLKSIQWQKGFFRIWIVFSIILLIVGYINIYHYFYSNQHQYGYKKTDYLLYFFVVTIAPILILLIGKILIWIGKGFGSENCKKIFIADSIEKLSESCLEKKNKSNY